MRLLNFPRMLVIDSKEVGLDPTFLADSKKHLPMETLLHFMALLPHSGSKYCLLHRIVVRIHETKHADSSVQLLSWVRLCNPMDCSMPGLPVHYQLKEFTQTHVHRVGEAIQPSPLPSIFPSIRIFSNGSVLCIRWP